MSYCGSTGFTKELNCLFYKASQPGQGSSQRTLLCWHWDPTPWVGSRCCVGSWILWGRLLRALRSGVRAESGAKPHSSGRGHWEILRWHHQGVPVILNPVHLRDCRSILKRLQVHIHQEQEQQQPGLILHCLVTCNSSCVEIGSKGTVHLASWNQGRLHLPALAEEQREVSKFQKWLSVSGYYAQNLCFPHLVLHVQAAFPLEGRLWECLQDSQIIKLSIYSFATGVKLKNRK